MTDQAELSQALLDVRKAYRVLYLFQRRALDLVQELSGKLGQVFYYWLPAGDSEAIQASKNPFLGSAWKMLPIHNASFLFLPPGADPNAPRKSEWLLEVLIYDDPELEGDCGRAEPDPTQFVDPAKSHSKIYLCAFVAQEDLQEKNWYNDIYKVTDWPEVDGASEINGSVRVVGLSADLASLPDPSAVESFADRFRELVKT